MDEVWVWEGFEFGFGLDSGMCVEDWDGCLMGLDFEHMNLLNQFGKLHVFSCVRIHEKYENMIIVD